MQQHLETGRAEYSSPRGALSPGTRSRQIEIELARVADHALEVQAERLQHRLGHRLDLLLDIVLAVERMLEIVERLGSGRGDDVADRAAAQGGTDCAAATCGGVVAVYSRVCLRRFL